MRTLLLTLWLLATPVLAQDFLESSAFRNLDETAQQAITLAVGHEEVQTFLEHYPNWRAETYPDSDDLWHIDFYDGDTAVGYTHVYLSSGELEPEETHLPEPLSPEERAEQEEAVKTLVFNDAEVLGILVAPELWDYSLEYDLFEGKWRMYFWRGLERLAIDFYAFDDGSGFDIERLYDPSAFEEAEAERVRRDEAVNLAYSAPGIDEALAGYDNWRSYAEPQGDDLWSVEFATEDESLITVLVDLETDEVVSAERP